MMVFEEVELQEGWSRTALARLVVPGGIQGGPFGTQLHASDYVEDGVPITMPKVIGMNGFTQGPFDRISQEDLERLSTHVLQLGDIVVGRKGDLSRRALVREPNVGWFCGTDCIRIRPDQNLADPEWLSYWFGLPGIHDWLHRFATGSTMPNLNTSVLSEVPVLVPPLPEQRAIAEVLGALDDKIESNRRMAQTIEILVEVEFLRTIRDAELTPMNPWVRVEMGSAFKGEFFSEPQVGRPLIRIRDLKTFEPQVWTTEVRPDELVIRPGDVVVGMDAEFRSTLWHGAEAVLNQRMCRFLPGDGVSRAFALFAIRDDLEFCERAKSGTTVIHLNKSDIDRFKVPELSIEKHARLAESTDALIDRLIVASEETRASAALRDTLLPALLSGRLRVPAAAELLGAVS